MSTKRSNIENGATSPLCYKETKLLASACETDREQHE